MGEAVVAGQTIAVEGIVWHEPDWEFDAPCVIYKGLHGYSQVGSICAESILQQVEGLAIDVVVSGEIPESFAQCDLDEFDWRGWSVPGFRRRKRCVRVRCSVRFFEQDGVLAFEVDRG